MKALMFTTAAIIFIATVSVAEDVEKHLFILSGQSNMTGGLKAGFARTVESTLGKQNVTVVMNAKSGRGLRFWDKDYRFPDNYQFPGNRTPEEKHFRQHGSLYAPLLNAVYSAIEGKTFDTVTFIWMQGESDAGRSLGDVYAESFLRLLARLKTDLKRKELNFVIGRLSDYDMKNQKSPHWTKMRDVQVKLAESHKNGAWIDTDDLNGGEPGKPGGHLHYPGEESKILGQRFAEKAIELIQKN